MSPNASMNLSEEKPMKEKDYCNFDIEKKDVECKRGINCQIIMLQVLLLGSIASALIFLFYALVSVFVSSPSLELKSMQVYNLSILDDQASARAKVVFNFRSKNDDFDIYVNSIQGDMFYRLQIISTAPMQSFVLRAKETMVGQAHFRMALQYEMTEAIEALRQDMKVGSLSFFMGLKIMGFFKSSFGWKIHFRMLGGCADVILRFKGENGGMVGETECSVLNSIFSPLTLY